ncbi:MAG: hypothetical protein ABI183_08200 [Polyangiaceae bacterium]
MPDNPGRPVHVEVPPLISVKYSSSHCVSSPASAMLKHETSLPQHVSNCEQ